MAVPCRFDFYVGITIIVETNKKVELFPWTNEVDDRHKSRPVAPY